MFCSENKPGQGFVKMSSPREALEVKQMHNKMCVKGKLLRLELANTSYVLPSQRVVQKPDMRNSQMSNQVSQFVHKTESVKIFNNSQTLQATTIIATADGICGAPLES